MGQGARDEARIRSFFEAHRTGARFGRRGEEVEFGGCQPCGLRRRTPGGEPVKRDEPPVPRGVGEAVKSVQDARKAHDFVDSFHEVGDVASWYEV